MAYDITIRVVPGHLFPVIGRPMILESAIPGRAYEIVPKEIRRVRWHGDGSVIVDLKATRKRIEEVTDDDR